MSKLKRFTTVLLTMFLLVGCSQATPAPVMPTATVPETATTPLPTATLTAEPVDQCVACHADQQRLVETAKVEEVVESESKGTG